MVLGNHISIDSMDDEPSLARFHRRLASFSRVIRFDRRGVGLSDPIAPSDPPTLEQLAEDALAVMDAAGSSSAACFADGPCAEAVLMAAAHPERIDRLLLVNSTARVMRAPDYPCGIPEHLVEAFLDNVTKPDAVEQGVDDVALLNPTVAGDQAFRTWWVRAGRRGASPSVAKAILRVKWTADVRQFLQLVQVPTLVLHRAGYAVLRPDHGRYLAEHIPGALFRELPGTDNLYWVGETDLMLEEIEEFLTGTRHRSEPNRVLATVLFTDIVDSTTQASGLGDSAWHDRLERHDAMVRRQLERFGGKEIKTIGDGFLATFDGPARAIRCACAIRDGVEQLGIDVRAGLHTGEVELLRDDVGGITVNIAARVVNFAGAGEVLASRTLADLVVGSSIEFEDRGEHELKGVPGWWRLFAVTG
jgi:class 3 adenylate cyclase